MSAAIRVNRLVEHILSPSVVAAGEALSNHQVKIVALPEGKLETQNFEMVQGPVPQLKDGQVLLRTLALTMGAGQRAGLQGSASYAGAPVANVVMGGTGVGRVEASRHPSFKPGELAMGPTGWQEQVALSGKLLTKMPASVEPAQQLGALGNNGLTAYFGLLEVGAPKPGDTVVVSAAAGSVGHLVGQMAKLKGAKVIGVAGSDEKCQSLVSDLGFDAAVNYKAATFREDFKKATPKRIDVYFDNTGGMVLESALFRMNLNGRIVCCGNVSQYDTSTPQTGPRGVPGLLVNNRVKMQGFLTMDFFKKFDAARSDIQSWIASGKLKTWHSMYDGLDKAPQAFVDLLNGKTQGTAIVKVAP